MHYFSLFVSVLLVGLVSSAYRKNVIEYWSEGDVEENKENGRSCGECNFPFQYENELYYACRENKEEQLVCKASNQTFIPCPSKCPSGKIFLWHVIPSSGPNDQTVILKCSGGGSPNPKITWKKDGIVLKEVDPPEDPYPAILTDSISLEYSPDDYGNYSCHMQNSYSSDSSDERYVYGTYDFKGTRLPMPPTNLRVTSIHRTYATFQWNYQGTENPGSMRKPFEMQLSPARSPLEEYTILIIRDNPYTVKHLQPNVTYTAKVRRSANRGLSRFSNLVTFFIPADATEDGPVNVTIGEVTTTSVSLSWDWDGDVTGTLGPYIKIKYSRDTDNGTYELSKNVWGEMRYIITDLVPNTEYTFKVGGTLVSGRPEKYAPPVTAKTPPQAPVIYDAHVDDEHHAHVNIICKAKGGPLPTVTWHRGNEDISTIGKINITSDAKTVTSILTLPRTADSYQKYECRAESSEGKDRWAVIVKYTGKHPPVALENMLIKLTEKLDAMAHGMEKLDAMAADVEKIKRDIDTLLTRSGSNK